IAFVAQQLMWALLWLVLKIFLLVLALIVLLASVVAFILFIAADIKSGVWLVLFGMVVSFLVLTVDMSGPLVSYNLFAAPLLIASMLLATNWANLRANEDF